MEPLPAPSVPTVPRLHVITPPRLSQDGVGVVEAALAAGVPCLQVRAKHLADDALLRLATAMVERCHAVGATCVINDRVDIALASGADGVHLGAHDLPVAVVRRLAGDDYLIGGTARDPDTARRLVAEGVDYLGVGPVHATRTKPGLPSPLGLAKLRAVVDAVQVPVLAIGGISATRVPAALTAGAHGVAVVGAVWDADDPAAATRALLERTGTDGPQTPEGP